MNHRGAEDTEKDKNSILLSFSLSSAPLWFILLSALVFLCTSCFFVAILLALKSVHDAPDSVQHRERPCSRCRRRSPPACSNRRPRRRRRTRPPRSCKCGRVSST